MLCKGFSNGDWSSWNEWVDVKEYCQSSGYYVYEKTTRNRTCHEALGGIQQCPVGELEIEQYQKSEMIYCEGTINGYLSKNNILS